jgi:hypothetical protein
MEYSFHESSDTIQAERLRRAWAPSTDVEEWLQVDLEVETVEVVHNWSVRPVFCGIVDAHSDAPPIDGGHVVQPNKVWMRKVFTRPVLHSAGLVRQEAVAVYAVVGTQTAKVVGRAVLERQRMIQVSRGLYVQYTTVRR